MLWAPGSCRILQDEGKLRIHGRVVSNRPNGEGTCEASENSSGRSNDPMCSLRSHSFMLRCMEKRMEEGLGREQEPRRSPKRLQDGSEARIRTIASQQLQQTPAQPAGVGSECAAGPGDGSFQEGKLRAGQRPA